MKEFVKLYYNLDETNSTIKKNELLVKYFQSQTPKNAIWAVYFFSGYRFKRLISAKYLRKWLREEFNIPKWLFDESMFAVGDTAETISLLIDTLREGKKTGFDHLELHEWIDNIQELSGLGVDYQKQTVLSWWKCLTQEEIFILNKLLTGAFRVGVSKQTTAKAVAEAFNLEKSVVLHRMMGNWEPTVEFYNSLTSQDQSEIKLSLPYPFYLASPLDQDLESLGDAEDWFVEWKWDGIRAQLIKREDQIFLWSRGEELINLSFPRIVSSMNTLPNGTVIDGEILAYHNNGPLAFSVLQRRIGRQDVNQDVLKEAPVILMIYDLLEFEYEDKRGLPHNMRRELLQELLLKYPTTMFKLSPILDHTTWENVKNFWEKARDEQAEGLMIKRKSATYKVGRTRGDWYKFKVDPLSLDVVLIYAQTGTGRRANLFTAYTFAVFSDDKTHLIPIGRAYSGLKNEEIEELDKWIRSNTTERFGPVRSVDPVQVFELGFDGVMTNEKSKSGMSLRFPRMLRWRRDKLSDEIDTLSAAQELLKFEGITEVKLNTSLDDFF